MRAIKIMLQISAAVLIIAMFMVLFGGARASAQQAHPNVDLASTGHQIYALACVTPADTDLAELCAVRTDLTAGVIELGCVPARQPNTEYMMEITVEVTPDDNAEIRCYVIDDEIPPLPGDYSDNAGIIDFTRPGKPHVVAP